MGVDLTDDLDLLHTTFAEATVGLVFGAVHWCAVHTKSLERCYVLEPDKRWLDIFKTCCGIYQNQSVFAIKGDCNDLYNLMPKPLDIVLVPEFANSHKCAVSVVPYLKNRASVIVSRGSYDLSRWYKTKRTSPNFQVLRPR